MGRGANGPRSAVSDDRDLRFGRNPGDPPGQTVWVFDRVPAGAFDALVFATLVAVGRL